MFKRLYCINMFLDVFLNWSSLLMFLMSLGQLFHNLGAAIVKDLSPNVTKLFFIGTDNDTALAK